MELLCNRIVDRMVTYDIVSSEDRPFYSYELQVVLESIIAHAVILLCALIFGFFVEVMLFTVAFSVLRMHTGGFHCMTNIGCVVMSVVTCALVVFVCIGIAPYYWIITIMALISAVVIYSVGTVNNANLDLSPDELVETVKISRKWLLISVSGLVILRFIIADPYYISFTEMGYVICALSMILTKNKERRNKP